MVAELLLIIKGYRPYLEKAVGFLKTRVSNCDVDDCGKLKSILRFVHCTLREVRCFGAISLDKIFTWVNASYSLNHDMKSQNGYLISMGLGVTRFRSSK